MQLFANNFIAHSDVSSNYLINFFKSLEKAEMVLSSANYANQQCLTKGTTDH